MTYSNEKQKPCLDCANNGVQTLIIWRANPEKPGINPNTGRAYMMPVEVATGQRHQCPYFVQGQPKQTRAYTTQAVVSANVKPSFTQNNQTVDNILIELKAVHGQLVTQTQQNDKILELLEILAGEQARKDMKPAQETYQNNTAYVEDPETTKQF